MVSGAGSAGGVVVSDGGGVVSGDVCGCGIGCVSAGGSAGGAWSLEAGRLQPAAANSSAAAHTEMITRIVVSPPSCGAQADWKNAGSPRIGRGSIVRCY